jgi:hypothetical protein
MQKYLCSTSIIKNGITILAVRVIYDEIFEVLLYIDDFHQGISDNLLPLVEKLIRHSFQVYKCDNSATEISL